MNMNDEAKYKVKNEIRKIIEKNYSINNLTINEIINFDDTNKLPVRIKFDLLLHKYRKQYKEAQIALSKE